MLAVADAEQLPVAQARRGEPGAWDALFRRYQLPIYVYVFELVHHEQTALDVVQETFVNAVRHLDSLRDDGRFGSWLFRIAHQKCIQHWREQKRAETLVELEAAESSDRQEGPLKILLRREDEAAFMTLLEQLSPPHRAVLLLRFIEDFSLEEIAAVTGEQIGTIKSRLHYAKKSLRDLLEENEP